MGQEATLLFISLTRKHTQYTYIIVPCLIKHSTSSASHKLSDFMECVRYEENHCSVAQIEKLPTIMGIKIKNYQGQLDLYPSSSKGSAQAEHDLSVIIQDWKKEVDSRFQAVVQLVNNRNEELMKQMHLMNANFESLAIQIGKQGKMKGVVEAGVQCSDPGVEETDGTRLLLPGLSVKNGVMQLDNGPNDEFIDSQVMEDDLYTDSGRCLFSVGGQITDGDGLVDSVGEQLSPFGAQNYNSTTVAVAGLSGLAGLEFDDTEDLSQLF